MRKRFTTKGEVNNTLDIPDPLLSNLARGVEKEKSEKKRGEPCEKE